MTRYLFQGNDGSRRLSRARSFRKLWAAALFLAGGSVVTLGGAGCSRSEPPQKEQSSVRAEIDRDTHAKSTSPRTTDASTASAVKDPSFVPFHEAVRLEPPDGVHRPPDATVAGKSTVKLFEAIAGRDGKGGLWNQVRFASANGKRTNPFAVVKTDVGDIKIELLADAAPSHVRSFICLAKSGYFDGLPFHTSLRREENGKLFGYLESGCPKGTGEIGYGSIGYWLKPEIKEGLIHEEGTVGAWHAEELEQAACRFYITLNRNPGMDGAYTIFGKVVEGLDVAHTINKRPIQDDEAKAAPQEPYRIRQVLILGATTAGNLIAAAAVAKDE